MVVVEVKGCCYSRGEVIPVQTVLQEGDTRVFPLDQPATSLVCVNGDGQAHVVHGVVGQEKIIDGIITIGSEPVVITGVGATSPQTIIVRVPVL